MVNFQSPLISLNSVCLILYFVFKKTDTFSHLTFPNSYVKKAQEKASGVLLITDGAYAMDYTEFPLHCSVSPNHTH